MDQSQSDRLARLEQRADDFDRRLTDLGTISREMATVSANVAHMDRDLALLRDEVEGITHSIAARDEAVSKERRETRLALYSMIGVLGASLIAGVAAVVVGLVGG